MKRTIKIARPANGSGTIVTVVIVENGVTVSYALKTFTTAIGAAIGTATKYALENLAEAKEHIKSDGATYE